MVIYLEKANIKEFYPKKKYLYYKAVLITIAVLIYQPFSWRIKPEQEATCNPKVGPPCFLKSASWKKSNIKYFYN